MGQSHESAQGMSGTGWRDGSAIKGYAHNPNYKEMGDILSGHSALSLWKGLPRNKWYLPLCKDGAEFQEHHVLSRFMVEMVCLSLEPTSLLRGCKHDEPSHRLFGWTD